MKRITILTITCIFAFTAMNSMFAQQGNVASGGEATGAGGSMSYSIGQVDYLFYSSPQGSISLGLQQTFTFGLPLVLEIPNTIVAGNDMLCFNAEQTVIVAGDGKHFIVEPNGFAEIIAGQNILLKEGTTIKSGGNLHAYISTIWCSQPENLLAASEAESALAEPIVETPLQNDFFKVYPNPTTGDFTLEILEYEDFSEITMQIFTMHGNLIACNAMPVQRQYSLSIAGRQPGVYLIRIIKDQKIGTGKIIKQ